MHLPLGIIYPPSRIHIRAPKCELFTWWSGRETVPNCV